MKNSIKIAVFLLLLLVLVLGIQKYIEKKGVLTESFPIQIIEAEIEGDVDSMKDYEENPHEELKHDDFKVFTKDIQLEVLQKNQDPGYVSRFLFGTASLKNAELFSSSFEFETLNQDLFQNTNENKVEVLIEMMDRLTRQQTLETINIIRVEQDQIKTDVTVELRLSFSDNFKSNIILNLIPTFTEHSKQDGIFSVSTSVWDIIQQLEGE